MSFPQRFAFISAFFTSLALARTDLTGCTSTDVSSPAGASVAWYVPGTGEVCAFLDCGGGTAPPMTTVPGCPLYSGTSTYSPSYLPGYGSATASPVASSTSYSAATTTSSPTVSSAATITASSASSSAWTASSITAISNVSASDLSSLAVPVISPHASLFSSGIASPVTGTYTICSHGGHQNCSLHAITTCFGCTGSTMATQTADSASNRTTKAGVTSAGATDKSTSSISGGTSSASTGIASGSSTSSSPAASSVSAAGAAETARVWMGSAGLVVGLGAVLAAL